MVAGVTGVQGVRGTSSSWPGWGQRVLCAQQRRVSYIRKSARRDRKSMPD